MFSSRIYLFFFLFFISAYFQTFAQNSVSTPFSIVLEPLQIPELGGLQSFAFGQHEDKYLIVGGRLDGLHRRQPFATFDVAGHNTQIFVVNPATREKWSVSLDGLSASLREQLSSTNMEFYQEGNYLYLIGGYGYSPTADDHVTHNRLTAVDVPALINAIIQKKPIQSHFRQMTDDNFAVTGGRLRKIDEVYYLVGGQKFMGRYNPMGPDHGPGFVQEYTNAVRRFTLRDDGSFIFIKHLPEWNDSLILHRRDYNLVPQIHHNQESLLAFSGVFQKQADVPFLTAVYIDSTGYRQQENFLQHYNHYHCATTSLYDSSTQISHSLLFGGIAEYYDSSGVLIHDYNVPFVRSIARIAYAEDGTLQEYLLPNKMPALLGAAAEFLPAPQVPQYNNGVIKLHQLREKVNLIGYLYGGINSTAGNIFWDNEGEHSTASTQWYKVYVLKNDILGAHRLNTHSTHPFQLQILPLLDKKLLQITFQMPETAPLDIYISDATKKPLHQSNFREKNKGEHSLSFKIDNLDKGGIYDVRLESGNLIIEQRIIVIP
ncbi:MAG: T9SS C-terminal target domain-containing protein [Sphingobacteriales bacterium]|nr:T9SS C-terminal target domain-containing protein [Sphingobacteriales bacterium]